MQKIKFYFSPIAADKFQNKAGDTWTIKNKSGKLYEKCKYMLELPYLLLINYLKIIC